ncbi:solute carrier family 45 member 3 [Synchiropus splendidus]|uniref:solute carrier family 45 member 3 n=1 Tax=Synchiropus splendidus TaxID=270530 RepID=UPI00237EACCF|nr:solute carrier family 45 member 3 [Synchiropus splendidus]XP_053742463.1 solute carrier family 45 member 3 [Synchiropus splendidus]XP_053742464.1 solute carrier family 45 member 3 [Synchiropus splendidus]XP_053742465.1 solute carrier family 45 member 3 [Synchiropus splendidus]XP_053742466.1 solute carrier family 45 member 3 [Synchiropus splendidus]XP_053742467.1 solute carrier family 45 member 3 [Synchiropus splendidus]
MNGWRSQWHLLLLNSLTCGLEICVAAGITYVPPLLLEAGVEERYMTMVLGIGPVLGLLFIPLIGSASDRCHSSYGRRRPFIWLLSLGVLVALLIIPHADVLAARLAWGGRTLQVGFLILGVGLLDFCGQVCFTPLEALLSDLYREEEDCSQAFAMFSFMVSVGGCIGYLLPAVDWSHSILSDYLGGQAECLFSLLILIFISSVLITMKVSEEPSSAGSIPVGSGSLLDSGSGAMEAGQCGVPRPCWYLLKCKLRLLKSGPLVCLLRTCWTMTPAIYRSYCHVPKVMRRLCVAQLCSWMAVMSFMLFFTDFVGEGLYQGVPSASPGSLSRQQYDEGIRMGSLGLFLQCATSTFFSLVMSRLVRHFGSRWVYLSSMVSFTVSALVICLSKSVVLVTAMAALTGYAYAMLQTLPYTLTCHYHKEKEIYMPKRKTKGLLKNGVATKQDYISPAEEEAGLIHHVFFRQDSYDFYPNNNQNGSSHIPVAGELEAADAGCDKRGVGLDFAILDSTFLLSQVFPTLFMGMIVQFAQSVTAYIACAAIFGVVAIYTASHIVFDQKDLKS